MDVATLGTIIGTGIGVVMSMYTFLRNFKTDVKLEISNFKTDIKSEISNFKTDIKSETSDIKSEISDMKTELNGKIDKLDEKVTDIDRRLCRLEGAFSARDFCGLKYDQNLKRAEGEGGREA